MNPEIEIEHKEIDGKVGKYQLVLNESFSLLHSTDIINIKLPIHSWSLIIKFIDNLLIKGSNQKLNFEGNTITLELTNWSHEYWQENSTPIAVFSTDSDAKTKLYIKIRTSTLLDKNIRNLSISIWKKN